MAQYRPDDARITPDALDYLRTPEGVQLRHAIAELPAPDNPTVSQVAALRKSFSAEPLHAALVLAKLQLKAVGPRGKFPGHAYAWATPEALEQATHVDVARYKGARFAELGAGQVFDLCSGIGGDTIGFAERVPVTAVEVSPARAKCLQFNVMDAGNLAHPVEVRVADVDAIIPHLPEDCWVHIDPARRSAGRRSSRFEDLIPGPEMLSRLLARPGIRVAIKLSPAVEFESLPAGHLELISHRGVVVQALLWIGTRLSPIERTATVLSRGTFRLTAKPQPVQVAPAPTGDFGDHLALLYELDGAITRAGLAQNFAASQGMLPLTSDGGYLLAPRTAEAVSMARHASVARHGIESARAPFCAAERTAAPLTAFHIRAIVPFASAIGTLRALPATPPGPVEVKCRGHVPGIDTDKLQQQWTQARAERGACAALLFRQEGQTLAALGVRATREVVRDAD